MRSLGIAVVINGFLMAGNCSKGRSIPRAIDDMEGQYQDRHLGQLSLEANSGLALGLQLLTDTLLAVAVVHEGLCNGARLVPEPVVQEEAVHVRSEQGRAHQVPNTQLIQLSLSHKPAQDSIALVSTSAHGSYLGSTQQTKSAIVENWQPSQALCFSICKAPAAKVGFVHWHKETHLGMT